MCYVSHVQEKCDNHPLADPLILLRVVGGGLQLILAHSGRDAPQERKIMFQLGNKKCPIRLTFGLWEKKGASGENLYKQKANSHIENHSSQIQTLNHKCVP